MRIVLLIDFNWRSFHWNREAFEKVLWVAMGGDPFPLIQRSDFVFSVEPQFTQHDVSPSTIIQL